MTTQITPLSTPPSRQDPANFSSRADTFLGELPTFATEANALALEVNQKAIEVNNKTLEVYQVASAVNNTLDVIRNEIEQATDAAVESSTQLAQSYATAASNSATVANQSAYLAQLAEQQSKEYANVAVSSANYAGDWDSNTTYSLGQTVSYNSYIYVSKTDLNLNQTPSSVSTYWFELKTGEEPFRKPTAISPVTGATAVFKHPTLAASPYAPLYSADTRLHRRFEVALLTDLTFSNPVYVSETNTDSVVVDFTLLGETSYHWRCRDVSTSGGVSAWMEANSFITTSGTVLAPTVYAQGAPGDFVGSYLQASTSAFYTNPSGTDTHYATQWQLWYKKLTGEYEVLTDTGASIYNLLSCILINVDENLKEFILKVRHIGTNYGPSDWTEISFSRPATVFDTATDVDTLRTITTVQQTWSSATTYSAGDIVAVYYENNKKFVEYKSLTSGNLNKNPLQSPSDWEYVYDNNYSTSGYFGEVLGNKCVVDKGEWVSTATYAIGDMVVVKKITTPLKQSDLTAYVAKTANTNKPPASNPADWEQRNGLPTGTSLAETLGLASATPEVLINNDSGWLKFVHKGQIKYIAKKPFMHSLSWNDIAKAEAVYGNRTVRIGSRLYRVSLLSGADADSASWTTSSTASDNKGAGSEWNELIYRIHTDVPTEGTVTSHGGKQVGSNWNTFTDADISVGGTALGRSCWTKETQASSSANRIIRGTSSLSTMTALNSGTGSSNVYGWRPCLTLVPTPESDMFLYNSTTTGVGPGVLSLQYDPITDTGYYGEVTSTEFYTGSQLSTSTGVTSGTLHNDTEGWLKFYWHGQILFVSKKTYRYNISWSNLNTAQAVYGVNLGSSGKKTINHTPSSTSYDVKLLKGSTKDTSPATSPGRQWNELIYRVCTGTEAGEIGANWANLSPNTDLGINSADGSYTWTQEVYKPSTNQRVLRGFDTLAGFYNVTNTTAIAAYGWRPCLSLVRS